MGATEHKKRRVIRFAASRGFGRSEALLLLAILTVRLMIVSALGGESVARATNELRFFAVSEKAIPGWRYVDTHDCPKVGYISNAPNFVVTSLQSVSTNSAPIITKDRKASSKYGPAVDFTFFPDDAKRLADFSVQNVDHRVLITLGDRPLIAPHFREAFETTTLKLMLTQYKDPETVVSGLKALVK